jgi:hypothetical protein
MKRNDLGKMIKTTFSKDKNRYDDGNCVEMALAIHKLIRDTKILVGQRYWTNEGIEYENHLSHVVVSKGDETWDSGGGNAIERWEELYENPYDCGGDENVVFDWVETTKEDLRSLVKKQRVEEKEINKNLVNKLSERLEKSLQRLSRNHRTKEHEI